MKQQSSSKLKVIAVAIVTALFSLIISSMIFNSPKKHNLQAPQVQTLSPTFPDVKNDPSYNTFLNNQALDATQPVTVGNNPNPKPFNQ
jgi:hypothetical protein